MAAKTSEKITVQFEAEKETPGTVRFAEVHPEDEEPVIGSLYVKKAALAKLLGNAKALTVTVEAK